MHEPTRLKKYKYTLVLFFYTAFGVPTFIVIFKSTEMIEPIHIGICRF